jgi:glyoxylase-like metal-dependent hydrolase (beta-lactamase superfamily II)
MRIEQLFDPATSTYSYLLWDEKTKQAALIDSVKEQLTRDIKFIRQLGLELKYTLETHIHADHVTGSGQLRYEFNSQVAVHKNSESECADILLSDGDTLNLGEQSIDVIYTPGHTNTDISYRIEGVLFTGDALLINGCGRTDFQSGDAKALYHSVTQKMFTLDDETIVYPGHDYNGFTSSTIGREKAFNPRLGNNKTEQEFVAIMDSLILEPPARIEVAVPGNLQCGLKAL